MLRPKGTARFCCVAMAFVPGDGVDGFISDEAVHFSVQLVANEAAHRVDVLIDGQPFSSLCLADSVRSRCCIR